MRKLWCLCRWQGSHRPFLIIWWASVTLNEFDNGFLSFNTTSFEYHLINGCLSMAFPSKIDSKNPTLLQTAPWTSDLLDLGVVLPRTPHRNCQHTIKMYLSSQIVRLFLETFGIVSVSNSSSLLWLLVMLLKKSKKQCSLEALRSFKCNSGDVERDDHALPPLESPHHKSVEIPGPVPSTAAFKSRQRHVSRMLLIVLKVAYNAEAQCYQPLHAAPPQPHCSKSIYI